MKKFLQLALATGVAVASLVMGIAAQPVGFASAATKWSCRVTLNGQSYTSVNASTYCSASHFYAYGVEGVEAYATRGLDGRTYCTAFYYQYVGTRWTPRYAIYSREVRGNGGCSVSATVRLGNRKVPISSQVIAP